MTPTKNNLTITSDGIQSRPYADRTFLYTAEYETPMLADYVRKEVSEKLSENGETVYENADKRNGWWEKYIKTCVQRDAEGKKWVIQVIDPFKD